MDIVFYNLLKYLYTCLEYLNEYRISEGKFECKDIVYIPGIIVSVGGQFLY